MTCEACTNAEANPEAGLTYAECPSCQAREIARVHTDRDPQATTDRVRAAYPIKRWAEMQTLVWKWVKLMGEQR